jgi:FkbM family methyltransferase
MTSRFFIFKDNIFSFILRKIKYLLFIYLTKNSVNMFLRSGDIISIAPQVSGIHEEHLTNFIKFLSKNDHNDFLIDIGANIGLTSCQNGKDFKEVHMYEPNPLCNKILEVNAEMALNSNQFRIYKFGLGEGEKNVFLTVPKSNWGGAFIKDSSNSYNDEILASKDNFYSFDNNNYFKVEINIKDTVNELKKLFNKLSNKNYFNGVIKIDVEGYEMTILKGIAKSLPLSMKVFIIFESWDNNFDIASLLDAFKERKCNIKKLDRSLIWKKEWSKMRKISSLIFNPFFHTKIIEVTESECAGDIVLEVS